MKLTKEAIEELKRIHLKVYGYEISEEEAMVLGIRLLEFFALVLPPKLGIERNVNIPPLNGKHHAQSA